MDGLCASAPLLARVLLFAFGSTVFLSNFVDAFPPWLRILLEVCLLSLAVYNAWTLRENLGTRAFTITVMSMEMAEALLSFLLLLPATDGLNRVALAGFVVFLGFVDMCIGAYYELRADQLVAHVATQPCAHLIYRLLAHKKVAFALIFVTLLRPVFTGCVQIYAIPPEHARAAGIAFFIVGIGQACVASLAMGSTYLCCLWCLRPTSGRICFFIPVALVGMVVEFFLVTLPLSSTFEAFQYLSYATAWSIVLCLPIIRLLETSILFRTFDVPSTLANAHASDADHTAQGCPVAMERASVEVLLDGIVAEDVHLKLVHHAVVVKDDGAV